MKLLTVLLSGITQFATARGNKKSARFTALVAAAKGKVTPRAAGGWVCIIGVLVLSGWDIVANDGANLDALAGMLTVALSI